MWLPFPIILSTPPAKLLSKPFFIPCSAASFPMSPATVWCGNPLTAFCSCISGKESWTYPSRAKRHTLPPAALFSLTVTKSTATPPPPAASACGAILTALSQGLIIPASPPASAMFFPSGSLSCSAENVRYSQDFL